jgi:hypothetical protein
MTLIKTSCHTILDMYTTEEFLTAEKMVMKMKEAVGFSGRKWSTLSMGFRYKRCSDARKLLMKCIYI